jgi:hypothetical protein
VYDHKKRGVYDDKKYGVVQTKPAPGGSLYQRHIMVGDKVVGMTNKTLGGKISITYTHPALQGKEPKGYVVDLHTAMQRVQRDVTRAGGLGEPK